MDPDYRNPYSQQWNMGYAYQITPDSVVEVEYIHGLAVHESKTHNINPRSAATGTVRPLDAAFRAAGLPLLGRIDLELAAGRSRYDGLNIAYRKRMSRGFTLNTNYVLSRAVAYNGNPAAFRNRATDPTDIFAKHDFGPAPNDERHRWVVSGVVDLPWRFRLAPIMQWASARPYNPIQGLDVLGIGPGRGEAHAILTRDNPGNLLATRDWNITQLRACIASGNCYQADFNSVRGQAFFQLDARVSKIIRLGDRARLELIFQAFDLTNRANFGNQFNNSVRSPDFGKPSGYITPNGVIVPRSFSGEIAAQVRF